MFRISAETCRRFTLTEVLIMSAMNVETMPKNAESSHFTQLGDDAEFSRTLPS